MLKNHLKVAWRNLKKNKAFSLINIFGLSVGMSAFMLILQYVSFELSFDKFHKNGENIYRIRNDRGYKDELFQKGVTTYPFVPIALKKDFPEVLNYVRIAPWIADHTLIKYGEKVLREKELLFAENSFFNLFSFQLTRGDATTALKNPFSIVLSETRAKQIFGEDNPIGKKVIFETNKPLIVTGVFKDVPPTSHIQFNMLVSYETLVSWMPDYANSKTFSEEVYAYLLLTPGTDIKQFNLKLDDFGKKYYPGIQVTGMKETFSMQSLYNIHLYSHFQYEFKGNGSAFMVWGLFGVAILIIVIAWCNYMNLSASHYTNRIKEIGVKKILGVTKKQFLFQYLIEALLISMISFFVALITFELIQPYFSKLVALDIGFINNKIYNIPTWTIALTIFIIGAVSSSFYPSFVLSSLNPRSVLKGKINPSPSFLNLNKGLVIMQFVVTIALISFAWVASQQLKFMTDKDLGVEIDGTLVVWGPMGTEWDGLINRMDAFKNAAGQISGVKEISSSKNVPGDQLTKIYDVKLKGRDKENTLSTSWVDEDFFDLYKMKMLAGRNFYSLDINKLIVNKSAVKLLGFNDVENIIGKTVQLWGEDGEVVGVVSDHHQKSMHNLVEPIVFRKDAGMDGYFSIKLSNQNIKQTLAGIKLLYAKYFQGTSFEYFFLEENFTKQYQRDQLMSRILQYFSFLAIFISCLGLMGLIIHSVMLRIKEIGIRKVLGATLGNLIVLISGGFLKLVLIAGIIASPLAWWVINLWLQNYAYRIEVNGFLFVVIGLIAMAMAFLAVGFQTIKAAISNPIKSLRTE